MTQKYDVLMVEVGGMNKRQITAIFNYVDELREALRDARDTMFAHSIGNWERCEELLGPVHADSLAKCSQCGEAPCKCLVRAESGE